MVDPDPSKKIFGRACIVIALLCCGNRWSPFSLNAEGKLKWGKPHFFLWGDIQKITLDDEDPHANLFSWTLRPEVQSPDALQNFFFGRYRSQAGKPWELNAEDALELMVLLLVTEQQEDRNASSSGFKPTPSILRAYRERERLLTVAKKDAAPARTWVVSVPASR
ncbi:MAG: hypothetical protein AAEJ57_01990 [Opitutales bacterium]